MDRGAGNGGGDAVRRCRVAAPGRLRNGRSELWHARAIAQRLPNGAADERPRPVPVRAIWNRDRDEPITGAPWALAEDSVALTPADRGKLVDATTTLTGTERVPAQASLLSPRELEILQLMQAGLSNQQISDKLIVSLSTIKTHTKHIYEKLGVANRAQALMKALETGLMTGPS